MEYREITASEWLERVKKIDSDLMTPWVRVSNNILYSLQWIGDEVLKSPQKKYYAFTDNEKIICCLGVYFLSQEVVRIRGFFCDPEWRGQGLMKKCLNQTLQNYRNQAKRALIFSPRSNELFYIKCGFKPVDHYTPRPLEYYDFKTNSYKTTEEDLLILERSL